ncbi:MAG: VWA domain-containing protein [Proteobacteria bacterium]|nr:VWA domain-containing protein [Pseudomonadota bacterium]
MPEFAWPWLLLALPLPWLVARLLPAASRDARAALRVPFAPILATIDDGSAGKHRRSRWRVLPLLGWILLCVAAARPQQLDSVIAPPRSGRDLMLAVDLSGSMRTQDMELGGQVVDRLSAIKAVLGDFLTRRSGDRVGLVVFGSHAYAVTPLTWDRHSVREQLAMSEAGLAGDATAIGDAITLAVKRLSAQAPGASSGDDRVLILLTDGVSNAGVIEPIKAAQLAAAEHVKIYTIGFGGNGQIDSMFGLSLPGADDGVDEDTLRKIATLTGGQYYRARDTESLAGIYAQLDRIEPVASRQPAQAVASELYPWPLGAALLVTLAIFALPPAPLRRGLA